MKHAVLFLCGAAALLFSCKPHVMVFSSCTLSKTQYLDTIPFTDAYGLISVPVSINGKSNKLIFDTGADMLLLRRDSLAAPSKIQAKATDSNNKVATISINKAGMVNMAGLDYNGLYALRNDFPSLLGCLGEGLIGNNMITRSHWKITRNTLIRSSEPLSMRKDNVIRPYFMYGSFRFFSSFTVNDFKLDSCLIDYGGHFEIDVPMRSYPDMMSHIKTVNATNTLVATHWGVGGKSAADTSVVVNADIDLSGITINNVNIRFSKSFTERRMGAVLLRRFNAVYINISDHTLGFELPVYANTYGGENPFIADIVEGQFSVDGFALSNSTEGLHVGERLNFINGRTASYFNSYCDFFNWLQEQKKQQSIHILTNRSRNFILPNPNYTR